MITELQKKFLEECGLDPKCTGPLIEKLFTYPKYKSWEIRQLNKTGGKKMSEKLQVTGVIKAVRIDKKGLQLDNGSWYGNSKEDLTFKKGNAVSISYEKNGEWNNILGIYGSEAPPIAPASNVKAKSKTGTSKKWEDDIEDFETLLTKAHELKDKFSVVTACLKVDLDKKYALFRAEVIVGDLVFTGHGDATDENVTGIIKQHFIRMAETRAIVRALRWYTNNGCAEEEK